MKTSKKEKREMGMLEEMIFEHTRNEDTGLLERTGINISFLYLMLWIVAAVIFGISKMM